MSGFLVGLAIGTIIALVLRHWARVPERESRLVTSADFLTRHREDEDAERALEHHCPNCDEWRTFLEVRITNPRSASALSAWIPDLRFCVGCGIVLHILQLRVPE